MLHSNDANSDPKRPVDMLFGSSARVDLLWAYFQNPDEWLSLSDLERITGRHLRDVQRNNGLLYVMGLVDIKPRTGSAHWPMENPATTSRKLYRINLQHPWIPALRMLLEQSVGSVAVVREVIAKEQKIDVAFIFGSYATSEQDPGSDIDLMLIGKRTLKSIVNTISDLERRLNREINAITYTPEEIHEKFRSENHFITSVLEAPKIFLVGDNKKLEEIIFGNSNEHKKVIAG